MENIQPWCVSRQLWWGHRIPAWFDDDGNIFVAETEEEAASLAAQHHGRVAGASVLIVDDEEAAIAVTNKEEGIFAIWRDPDVLDTWFSSALWPFATLGWPDDTETLRRPYPNDVLVSGFDILFFWDEIGRASCRERVFQYV